MNSKYFLTNPYPYKFSEDGRTKEDSEFLQKILNKSEKEVKLASSSYQGNADGLRSFIFIVRSYENLRSRELTESATSLAVAIIIFAIEGLMSHSKKRRLRKGKKLRSGENEDRVSRYIRKCFTKEEKLLLLNSFVFSSRFSSSIPMRKSVVRHLMYRGAMKPLDLYIRKDMKTEWCSCQESVDNIHCGCITWLSSQDEKKVNYYIRSLSKHLYKMRCAIVHDGVAPLISHTEVKPSNVAIWGMTVSDIYLNNRFSKHYKYESALSRAKLEDFFISSLWIAFKNGYPKKR